MDEADSLSEEARNRLLRRVDWRFLLPNPHPEKTICFGNRRLARALALVSGQVVHAWTPAIAAGCDLAVAVNPDERTLSAAQAALVPGGICYAEWYSPTAGGVRGIRRQLRAAGFDGVTCYWAWPWPSLARTRFWIPLEAPGALRYFQTSRPIVADRPRRWIRALARELLTLLTLRVVPFPVCSVSCKPAESAEPAATRPELAQLRTDGESRRQSWLILTGGTRTIHKVVGLVFDEPDSKPRAIVKWPRVPEAVDLLRREATSLKAVQTLHPGGVRGVPQVLFCEQNQQGFALGETAMSGVPLYTQLNRANAHTLAVRAADWLVELAGPARRRPPAAVWTRQVEPLVAEFESTFGPALEPLLLRKTRTTLETLTTCPVVIEHRDFSPWNVLVTPRNDLAVLDWEGAQLQGLPALDLLYFLSHLAFYLDGAYRSRRFRASYQTGLDPTTFTGRLRTAVLAHYMRRLDLDPALLGPLRLLVWLVHARSEYRRMLADTTDRLDPRRLRTALFVTLWKEELINLDRGRT